MSFGGTARIAEAAVEAARAELKRFLGIVFTDPPFVPWPVDKALAILEYTPKAASELLFKLVNSAAANAENNHNMDKANLYVAECWVTPGPTLKRIQPKDHGKAFRILKRTSHITVVLKEMEA